MQRCFTITVLLLLTTLAWATTYRVGPGQPYTELDQVPWLTLQPGDSVLIFWRDSPYATKIFLRVSGTAEQPIVIKGQPNANGDLPIITGQNASTPTQFAGYFSSEWTEDLGLFLIERNRRVEPTDPEDYKPKHLTFESLALTGVKPENTFTDQFGQVRHYNKFSSAIHALMVDHLTVKHCQIYDNAQGIFTNSNGNTEGYISRNILIEHNYIWGNGNADEDGKEHNIYTQAAGTIIQFNFLGTLRTGSVGANIKDRSSGTVIRYNWIEGAARMLDLVETEDAAEIIMNEPNYHDVYVYGNVFVNDMTKENFGVNLIHFGHDNSPVEAKRGTLFFYHNTVHIKGDKEVYWYNRLFDVTTDEGQVALFNNIIYKEGTTHLELMADRGTLTFYANNWIQDDYTELAYGASAQVVYETPPLTGTEPGFVQADSNDYHLQVTSPCLNQAGELPDSVQNTFPLNWEYVNHAAKKPRQLSGSAFDLGAFEADATTGLEKQPFYTASMSFRLQQNYPNPFNPLTHIRYTVPSLPASKLPAFVRLVVFDITGKQVKVLVNTRQMPGTYTVAFDGQQLATGIYFYQLQSNQTTITRKMILLR